ncbi:hypothetical protein H4R33_001936 [Dimargaris cristalligena]|uniref:Piwi domain-containing protein n=1 Tax=Dimargaris cristalligena TaxID=215637 RepID=A0A4V1J4C9_9FUNG|nr:hypothetical protein H4R33_001936 [Dimargaris cristalligena]RKP35119.1 Piwi domain-containing protein [Dimargaris cristalligena]|eukprot:RKP35119.1 Piwi domain-containing protein [Dimargaris cristalligena]
MSEPQVIAQRPDFGKLGSNIPINANFIEIEAFGEDPVHHYDLKILPEVPAELGREVFQVLENQLRHNLFQGTYPVFDGKYNMYSPVVLALADGKGEFDVYLPRDQKRLESAPAGKGPKPFKVSLRNVAMINMGVLREFVSGRIEFNPQVQSAISILDVAFHHLPASKYPSAKNSFYTSEGKQAISGGIEVWPGLFQSVRPTQGRVLLNVDVSSTAFYAPGSLLNSVVRCLNKVDPLELLNLREHEMRNLQKMIKGIPVTLTHRDQGERIFKLKGISERGANQTMFNLRSEDETETKMSVAKYFSDHLNIPVRYPTLPCVELKRGTMVPIEFCTVVSGQRFMRKLDERQTAEMIKFTCVRPQERFKRITKQASDLLCFNSNPYLKAFGIKLNGKMLSINGRQLPPPTVVYGGNSKDRNVKPKDGSWNMRDKCFVVAAEIPSYGVLVLDRENGQSRKMVSGFMGQLNKILFNMGIELADRTPSITFGHYMGNFNQSLEKAQSEARRVFQQTPRIIYVLVGSTASSVYGEIKRISDTKLGIITQCMQLSKIRRPNNIQYMANVALKINVKLGGINCLLEPKQTTFISGGSTMVIGADVTHPGPGNNTDPSIAAVVGSIDKSMTRFVSEVSVLPPRTEIIASLSESVSKMLKAFKQENQCLPRRILFYRDGVSETQFQTVLVEELAGIKKAAEEVNDGESILVTFITCQKRHHVRFSPLNPGRGDRSGNCPAGTVVDRGVTHPKEFDFFLQSQGGLQGTCRPTRYTVLYDDNDFTADDLQQLTNQLCYLYPRCTRSVSLCPPAYFADLLASRARFHRGSRSDFEDNPTLVTPTTGHRDDIQLVPVMLGLKEVLYFM